MMSARGIADSARGAADAGRRGPAGGQPFGADRQSAPLAGAVAAVRQPVGGPVDGGELISGLVEQGGHVLPVERGRRALRVVLVVGGRGCRRGDYRVEVPLQRRDPRLGSLALCRQGAPRGGPSAHHGSSAASWATTSAAGRSAAARNPSPAYRLIPPASPAAAARARSGRVALLISGYPAGASGWSSRNRLTSARAGRPLKARVTAVAVNRGSASAALCSGWAPLSAQRRNAVPTETAAAPVPSAAATPAASAMPPAAMSGRRTSATSARRSSSAGLRSRVPSLVNVPECAPASRPWTMRQSAPAAAAWPASPGLVTVIATSAPRRRSLAIVSGGGQPNVKLTTAGGSASNSAILSAQASSSHSGLPASPPQTRSDAT